MKIKKENIDEIVKNSEMVTLKDDKIIRFAVLKDNLRNWFTLISPKTNKHISFYFVPVRKKINYINKQLGIPSKYVMVTNNKGNFKYLGTIFRKGYDGRYIYIYRISTSKGNFTSLSVQHKTFKWLFERMMKNSIPRSLTIKYNGRCIRCRRVLTDPKSIERGYGPICAKAFKK